MNTAPMISALFLPAVLAALTVPAGAASESSRKSGWGEESPAAAAKPTGTELRLRRLEADLGNLRKQAMATPVRGGIDARLDSLADRLAEVEASSSARADNSLPRTDSGLAMIRADNAAILAEIRSLATLLREAPGPAGAAGPAPAAPYQPSPATPPASSPSAPAPKADPAPAFDLKADIQIQGERRLTTASHRDNLDDFWGRLNFGAEYKAGGFQSKANIRVFPEGFGFEPLTGATFDTSGQGALKTQSQPAARVVVNHAWVRSASGPLHAKVGRFETQESHSGSYGNYIDLGPSGRFLGRPAAHNALEAGYARGPHASTVLLGTGDRRLNRGFVRLLQRYRAAAGLDAAVGYRANVFDRLQFPDDEILQRFDMNVLLPLPRGFAAFAEAALLQAPGREDDVPVLLGLRTPAGRWLDLLSLEAEWMDTRKAGGEDKPILLNLHARKAFGRARFEASLFSDPADKDAAAFGLGLRMTTTLK